jgi:hypothetical protein
MAVCGRLDGRTARPVGGKNSAGTSNEQYFYSILQRYERYERYRYKVGVGPTRSTSHQIRIVHITVFLCFDNLSTRRG